MDPKHPGISIDTFVAPATPSASFQLHRIFMSTLLIHLHSAPSIFHEYDPDHALSSDVISRMACPHLQVPSSWPVGVAAQE